MTNNKITEKIMKYLIWTSGIISVGIMVWIVGYIIYKGAGELSFEFLSSSENNVGIFPMIINTLILIFYSLIFSIPVGIISALYLVEYAKPGKVVRAIRFAVESLAGIPSILFGLFGMMFFVVFLKMGWSMLSGALTVSIMILPTIIRTTEEALLAVPSNYREGSLGLGASKFYTIRKVIIPSALPGIMVAVILSTGRIIGETAAVYLTAGMVPRIADSMMKSGRTLSVHMYILAKEGISFDKAYATATVLILIVFIINTVSRVISNALKKAY
ncbi:MAG: phosphate ABC transporter permease PstA [Acidaminobacteraceae bacterium]